jgi:hypothetical protein
MEIITWLINIKFILENKRKAFLKSHQWLVRETVIENVRKILGCWANLGFVSYKCDCCGELKHVFFTCKSRFCNSCSKPQSDLRTHKLYSRLPRWISYNHLVFTIPLELRVFFKRHRKALILLPKTASDAICFFLWKQQKCIPWIIAVIHTFGSKLNRNPHTHLLVTHWAYSKKENTFIKDRYIPYKAIRKSRTTMLVKNLKERCKNNLSWAIQQKEIAFLNTFYNYHSKVTWEKTTRHVYFSKHRSGFETIIGYIGRYIKRPVIAQSRILDYDWEHITFCYVDKTEKDFFKRTKNITCSDIEFIESLVQHIPNKYFHMIFYYGIFANRIKNQYINIINTLYHSPRIYPRIQKYFRGRFFIRIGRDPFRCYCWWYLMKYQINIPWYKPQYFDTS